MHSFKYFYPLFVFPSPTATVDVERGFEAMAPVLAQDW
jgi:hypothetical protein